MTGRILRQYLEDYDRKAQRTVAGQPSDDQLQAALRAVQNQHIGVSSSKGRYRGWVSNSVANNAQRVANAVAPNMDVQGGLRPYKSSRKEIEQAKRYQQQKINELRGIFSGRARGWHGDAMQGRLEDIIGAFDRYMPKGIRYHGAPTFTTAQERKLTQADPSHQMAAEARSGEDEDRGLIGRMLAA